ncbi:tripartite tricarboxylate transporter TctB family protein [Dysosmobacter sp. Phy]
MLRKYRDAIIGGIVILLAALLFLASLTIKSLALNLIKADFFPKMDAVLLGVLGLILLTDGLKKAKRLPAEVTEERGPKTLTPGTRCMLETLALIAVYIFCLEPVGFMLSTFVYLIVQMIVLADDSHRKKKDIVLFVIISAIVAVGVYMLFTRVFYLMLPRGILG